MRIHVIVDNPTSFFIFLYLIRELKTCDADGELPYILARIWLGCSITSWMSSSQAPVDSQFGLIRVIWDYRERVSKKEDGSFRVRLSVMMTDNL